MSRATRRFTLLYDTVIVWLHAVTPPAWANRLPALAYGSLLLRPEKVMTRDEHSEHLHEGPAKTHWSSKPAQRREAIQSFIDSIQPSDRPALHYFHVLAPHVPYVFEPSGKICADSRHAPIPAFWYHSPDARVLQQRLLMQVGFVDTMVGRLLDHLERTGLYDRTLLVLVGDHGISFRPNEPRRPLSKANGCDILPVPLFIKAPNQRSGQTVDRNVEVVDVLPTMAAVLGISVPWRIDGHSAFDTSHPERKGKIMVGPLWGPENALPWKGGRLGFPPDQGIRCLTSDRPNPDVAWGEGPQRVFRRGPYGALLGRPVGETIVVAPAGFRIVFTGDDPTAPYAADAEEVPCVIEGQITVPDGSPVDRDLLIAINGVIEATGRSAPYPDLKHPDRAGFMVAVPAAAFRDRRNEIQVFLPQGEGAATRLVPAEIATAAADRS